MSQPSRPWRSALLVVAMLAGLSFIAVEPPGSQRDAALGTDLTGDGVPDTAADGSGDAAGPGTAPTGVGPSRGGGAGRTPVGTAPNGTVRGGRKLECRAGANGGKTDKGVTGDKIKLAATNVRSGPGSSFLGSSWVGMQAIVNKVNAKGGVCGRRLELTLVDDGWDAARGATYIANFAKGDYFALPVVPSSEGLTQAIKNGTIDRAGIPVVGTDGMLKEQYQSPWVWPVATSTSSMMRVMVKHAYDQGARSFGIVYDTRYRFGVEGKDAFVGYVRTLSGATVKSQVPLQPSRPSYSGEANQFNEQCGPDPCDFVAMLLEPTTANTYIRSQSDDGNGRRRGFGKFVTGAAQPLFNDRFARDCGEACDGTLVWSGYVPAIGRAKSQAGVAQFERDVKGVDPNVDVNNQFLEGAYLGMQMFVQAIERVGPNLTRANLRAVLNGAEFTTPLASPLRWKADSRCANVSGQAFRIVTASGSFAGFAEAGTGFRRDPQPCVFPKD